MAIAVDATMTFLQRQLLAAVTVSTLLFSFACNERDGMPAGPGAPVPGPPAPAVTANAYILPNAVSMGDFAFGDEPIVIFKGERLRWINLDSVAHDVVADSPDATDFRMTAELRPGGDQSFVMTRLGTTRIHCSAHPSMTGTLIATQKSWRQK